MTYSRLSDCLLPTLVCLQFCLGMPSPSAAKESKDSEEISCAADQKLVQRILDASGGGKQTGKKWELNNHWVGDLKFVVGTGRYRAGKNLRPYGKSIPTRLNAMRECFGDGRTESHPPALIIAWGRYSSSSYYFHEHLPSLTDIRDPNKLLAILADFGDQPGFTTGWGDGTRMHSTKSWECFNFSENGEIRVLSIFAHVSHELGVQDAEETIDHMIVREGFLRKSDPNNAEDLKRFPTPAKEADERQQKIEQADAAYPEPLRSLLQAKHTKDDSDLKNYFAAISEFRKQPDRKLLEQLVAHLDDGTALFSGMADCLFDSEFRGTAAAPWPPGKRKEACRLLIKAIPFANSRSSMQKAVELALRESGIESLEMNRDQINVSVESRYTENGRKGLYRRFKIDSNNIRRSGEIIRDELLSQM